MQITAVGSPPATRPTKSLKLKRKIHVYDSDTGRELTELKVGATTSGPTSMYELNGRQYLLVTASPVGTRIGNEAGAADPAQTGPTGLIDYAPPNGAGR
jgi:hypothetical protein